MSKTGRFFNSLIWFIAGSLMLVGVVLFYGYINNLEAIYRPVAGGPASHPLTAASILLSGLLLLSLKAHKSISLSTTAFRFSHFHRLKSIYKAFMLLIILVLVIISSVNLYDHIFKTDYLYLVTPFSALITEAEAIGSNVTMGYNTSLSFLLTTVSMLTALGKFYRISQITAYIGLAIPVISLQGYLFQIENFYGQMAVSTSICLTLLAAGSLFLTINHWVLLAIFDKNRTCKIARFQILSIIVFPSILNLVFEAIGLPTLATKETAALVVVSITWFAITLLCITTMLLYAQENITNMALKEVSDKERKFRDVFEYSTISKLIIDNDGKISMANPAAESLLKITHSELIGMNIDKFVPQKKGFDHASLRKEFYQSTKLQSQLTNSRFVDVATLNGEIIPVELNLVSFIQSNEHKVVVSMIDRRELIKNIKALERSNKELEQFAYVASHDLRSPLRTMANMAAFLEEDLQPYIKGDTRQYMDLLQRRIKRLEKLLDDLLQYSRLGRKESESQNIDLNKLISDCVELYVPSDQFDTQIDCSGNLYAPHSLVEVVVRNLIMNAIKHHDKEKGTIIIKTLRELDTVKLSVEDDGPGIEPEYRERIFNMFTTLKSKDKTEGSGMGLSMVKKAVESYGGYIDVSGSNLGGVKFEVTFKDFK